MHFGHLANKDDGIPLYSPSKHLLSGVKLLVYLYSAVKVTVMLKIFIYLLNIHPLCRCWQMITPPFRWVFPFLCTFVSHLCCLFRGFLAFGWRMMTYEASSAWELWTLRPVGWWEKRRRDVNMLHQQTWAIIQQPFMYLWPGVHGTDSRWCNWSNQQCSRPREQTVEHSSPSSWLSYFLSCW